jgi:hypothetical protein
MTWHPNRSKIYRQLKLIRSKFTSYSFYQFGDFWLKTDPIRPMKKKEKCMCLWGQYWAHSTRCTCGGSLLFPCHFKWILIWIEMETFLFFFLDKTFLFFEFYWKGNRNSWVPNKIKENDWNNLYQQILSFGRIDLDFDRFMNCVRWIGIGCCSSPLLQNFIFVLYKFIYK